MLTAKPYVINTFGIFAIHIGKLLQRYTSSNLHVALALWAFCYVFAFQQGVPFSFSLQCAVFGFGWAAYQYLHVFVPFLYKQQSLILKKVFPFVLALSLGFYGLISQPVFIWIAFGFVGVLTFCYALPLGAKMGLRFVPTLKIFVVALCWAVLAMLSLFGLSKKVFILLLLKALLWMICLILPFELRDIQKDEKFLKTLPQLLGVHGVKLLGFILIGFVGFVGYYTVPVNNLLWVEWGMLLLLGISLYSMSSKRSPMFTSFWVEGIPILWLAVSLWVSYT
ncbi:MAG: hypothetical protein O2810_02950 [Bacteroidetes bacterium]|nr:hypothetical protein [Bacteroidota bacterium]MDA0888413.1 hypothetical protein [Bacteroidota bacterium]MDA1084473.1 hypothetical protein [Bacteroidota bacterium]